MLNTWSYEGLNIQIGKDFEIFLLEQQQYNLISQMIISHPSNTEIRDGTIQITSSGSHPDDYPTCIYKYTYNNNTAPYKYKGDVAFKVQIRQCLMMFPGHVGAVVVLRPVSYVRIENIVEMPSTRGTYDVKFLNVGMKESREIMRKFTEKWLFWSILDYLMFVYVKIVFHFSQEGYVGIQSSYYDE